MGRVVIAIFIILQLVACGSTKSDLSTEDALATISADMATPILEPTLTAIERDDLQSVLERAKSASSAATELLALGSEIRATAVWEAKVRAQASLITAAQTNINSLTFPVFYKPLGDRARSVADQCAQAVENIVNTTAGSLEITNVSQHSESLERCVRDMTYLQVQVEGVIQ